MLRMVFQNRWLGSLCLLFMATGAFSEGWQVVAVEQGKRVEIDRGSISTKPNGDALANGRLVLDRPIPDPRTGVSYRTIEFQSRYDCIDRTHATLKRSYFKEDGELLRREEIRSPFDMPVRTGSPDDKLLREVCKPLSAEQAALLANRTVDKVNEVAGDLRKANQALVDAAKKEAGPGGTTAGRKRAGRRARPAEEPVSMPVAWGYEGAGGPEYWGQLEKGFAGCASGRRQSPLDIRHGIAVDLEVIRFNYRPSLFRVVDTRRSLDVVIAGGGFELLGKTYELGRIHFHRPAETLINGKRYDMEAQMLHLSADGEMAVVSVLLEQGNENPLVQQALNNLPLDKGGEVAPPDQTLDANLLLPPERAYYTFKGSLTTPPCTENVLWVVLKSSQTLSPAQLGIFQRLYPPNARPVQPDFGRMIKESR